MLAALYRGELLLTAGELASLNLEGYKFELSIPPATPVAPAPSTPPTKKAKLDSAGKFAGKSSKVAAPPVAPVTSLLTQPQSGKPVSGWRLELLKVCDALLSDPQARDSVSYWFGSATPPETVDGVTSFPFCLSGIRARLIDGRYDSHFAFQADLSNLTEFVFSRYGLYSTPFQVAIKLRREATALMQQAVKKIKNEEYYAIPEMPALPTDEPESPKSSVAPKSTASVKPAVQKKKSEEPSEQSLLLDRIAALEREIERVSRGGERPMSPDEIAKLESDIAQLPNADIKKLVDEKLKGQPGLSYDGVGEERTAVIEIPKMPPRLQRNLRRFVTMRLNELRGQPSVEKLKRIAKQDTKAKQTEQLVEKMLADRRVREENAKRQREEDQESGRIDRDELARLRELRERDENARRILELMALDAHSEDDDDGLD